MGKGSNILVRDGGIEGAVIVLRGRLSAVEKISQRSETLMAGGGLSISRLLSYCGDEGLSGLEFMAGIPGTVGGAVFMNAGAFGKEMGDVIQEVMLLSGRGEQKVMPRSQLDFSYRESSIPKGCVIYNVKLKLHKDQKGKIIGRITENLKKRKEAQPLDFPSAGSIFRNPPEDYAGRLIEEAGLKGTRIGGAMISPKHANYIINIGGAKAKDILELIALAQDRIRKATGILLEPEIKVVGK
jgi:UDP-N-acetylmuramate dehydrogenase